jgi:hypothetical protein
LRLLLTSLRRSPLLHAHRDLLDGRKIIDQLRAQPRKLASYPSSNFSIFRRGKIVSAVVVPPQIQDI